MKILITNFLKNFKNFYGLKQKKYLKIISCCLLLLFVQTTAVSKPEYTCPVEEPQEQTFCTILEKIFLFEKIQTSILEKYIKTEVQKYTGSDTTIKIKAHNSKALRKGIIKEINLYSDKVQFSGCSASDVHIKTLCKTNKIKSVNNKILILNDIPAEFSAIIASDDLNYSTEYLAAKNGNLTQITSIGKNLFSIDKIIWNIENSKIKADLYINSILIKTKISTTCSFDVQDGKIRFYPQNMNKIQDVKIVKEYLEKRNPLNQHIQISQDTDIMIYIDEIKPENDKLYIKGMFIIPSNYDINNVRK